ncbi:hypothetical protein WA026_006067 [Henosepilachna vigintioctopunctata]|uniref:Protein lethal(2)denticleless n=1 Tax=Henosepilachna vigintioctopunctata TaxID=420089 RepID=A0AAW1TMT6_9CUCU
MNPVQAYFDQQYGYVKNVSYQPFLSRLRCLKKDDFSQIYPNQSIYPDTPIFACKFSEKKGHENLLALANEDGKVALHDVRNEGERSGLHAHNNAIFDLTWLFNQLKIVTASGDHSSKLYNISNSGISEERTFCKHERSVKSIASSKDDPSVFATGGRDGNIILWDIRADSSNTTIIGKSDKIIKKSHVSKMLTPSRSKKHNITGLSQNNSVTGLVFQDFNTLISCGAGDGCIKIWDLRKTHYNGKREPIPKFTLPYPGKSAKNGFSNLTIDSNCIKLYANCLDNNIYCYNIGTYDVNPIMTYYGHQNNTFYIKSALSYDGSFLMSGSSDENAYIWNLKNSEPICKLTGHTAEVTCVAWCQSLETCIVTCSDDIKHKLWRIGTEDLPEDFEIEGKGKTEILPLFNRPINSRKRIAMNWELVKNVEKKFITVCERCLKCTDNARFCENCNYTNKRNISNTSSETKRLQTEFGPRKLFTNLDSRSNDENTDTTHKKRKYDEMMFSPLKNLPNFVIDGVAPHLKFSPPNKKQCDWLTMLRINHNFKRKMLESTEENSTKIVKLEATPKNKPQEKTLAQKSPLLKYFRVTNNSMKCEKHPNSFRNCISCDRTPLQN